MSLVNRNAALLVKDAQARTTLVAEALALLNNADQRAILTKQIKLLARPNAASDISQEIRKLT